ncbi:pentatricopeptide repeat-containing protein At1g62670, mitochondrial [Selaginella moellendorffii]|uniref:pentatricopeptide repeat-containing protein At1g62670, mitochondrial n=1 Tax=Selaginella moellendorffii TaxID=88036 RepID=UPI000D1C7C13|nr:pentatricopeptide repeat-containing protein At1g62670, mitochondrial [Selaginella moellendorffii]|eukprot:XP_024518665.1 pentatricopeptide repeat-containing protein At1g62670, mitochondrial [Selaginella moellendorffii]
MRRLLWRWRTTTPILIQPRQCGLRSLCCSSAAAAQDHREDTDEIDKVCSILFRGGGLSPAWRSELKSLNLDLRPQLVASVLQRSTDVGLLSCFFQWAQRQERFQHEPGAYEAMLEVLALDRDRGQLLDWLLDQVILKCRNTGSSLVDSLLRAYMGAGNAARAMEAFTRLARVFKPNITLCNAFLGLLLEAGEYELASQVLHFMMLHGCYPEDGTFRLLMAAAHPTKAFELFQSAIEIGRVPSFGLNRPLLEFVCRAATADQVCRVAHIITDGSFYSDLVTCNSILNGFRLAGKCDDAYEFFQTVRAKGCNPDDISYRILVLAHCRAGSMERALELFKTMQSIASLDVRTCNIMVDSLCKGGLVDDAAELVHGMMDKGPYPDTVTCNSLLDGLFKVNKVEHAMKLYEKMSRSFVKADAFTYNILLHGLCKAGRIQEACQKLSAALRDREAPVRHELLYEALIGGLCKVGKYDHAMAVFRKMKLPSSMSYNIVIAACVKRGRNEAAVELFREMKVKKRVPDIFTFNTVIQSLSKAGKFKEALDIVDEMVWLQCSPNELTFGLLVHGLCKAKRALEAESVLEVMDTVGCVPDVVLLTALISGHLKEGRVDDASRLFERMLSGGQRWSKPNLRTFNIMIHGLCKANKVGEADALVRRMEDECGVAPDEFTFNTIIDGHFKAGDSKGALSLFKEMARLGRCRCSVTLNTVVTGLCKAGEVDRAVTLVRDSASARQATVFMYNVVIDKFAKLGRFEASKQLFQEMSRFGCHPDSVTFTILVSESCKQRRTHEALELVEQMTKNKGCSWTTLPFNMVLNALAKSGEMEAAGKVHRSMKVAGIECDLVTYNTLLDGYFGAGRARSGDGYRVFGELLHSGCAPDTLSFNALLGCLCCDGRLEEAVAKFWGEMRERRECWPDAVTHALLVRQCCKQRNIELACRIVDEMLHRGFVPTPGIASMLVNLIQSGSDDARHRQWLQSFLSSSQKREDSQTSV